jgi:hypothetical protein
VASDASPAREPWGRQHRAPCVLRDASRR